MTETSTRDRDALERVVQAARRRVLVRRALHELDVRFAPLCPLLAMGGAALILSGAAIGARFLIGIGVVLGLGFSGRALFRARLTASLSAALDESFRGRGVLGSAVDFLERDPASLDSFQRLVLRDAARSLSSFRLKAALPVGFRLRHASTLLSLGLVGLLTTFSLEPAGALPSQGVGSASVLERARGVSGSGERALEAPEAAALLDEKRNLERSIEEGALSPEEGFQRLAALERKAEELAAEEAQTRAALLARGEALDESPTLSRLAEALKRGNLEDARRALEVLADRLRDEKHPLSQEELAALRAGIERAQRQVREASAEAAPEGARKESGPTGPERARAEGAGAASAAGARSPENQRRLERLGDQRQKKAGPAKELSELDRQLAEAARDLQEDREQAGERFAQAAETMGKLSESALSDEQKRELLEALRRMRERLREKSESKAEQDALDEFRKKAQGKGAKPPGEGSEGDSEPGEGTGQRSVSISVSMDVPESGPGSEGSEGGDSAPPPNEGEASSGSKPGKDHSPDPSGPKADPMSTEGGDRLSVAQNQQEGADEAQTVASAARTGFTGARYKKLFQEYESAREEILRRDHVPSGYRARVLRYFDLIRPRSDSSPPAHRAE